MRGFLPSLLDKLIPEDAGASPDTVPRFSMEQMKDAVARDLENLLNTRAGFSIDDLQSFPESRKSILSYGLHDFAGLSLASIDDRAFICRCLEQTIAHHEPRLKNVQASLERVGGSINRLNFAISATLVIQNAKEPVNFDAVLQPSTLQYSISKTRRFNSLDT